MQRVIVIGAGLAGITAARELAAHGHAVTVLEKSRGYGGRMATRRVGEERLDHGAPFFTIRAPRFRQLLEPLIAQGTVRPWVDRLHRWDGGHLFIDPQTAGEQRYAAPLGMAAVVRELAQDLDVRLDARATQLAVREQKWQVTTEGGSALKAEIVVLAIPAAQAANLVVTAEAAVDAHVATALAQVGFAPCLVLLAGYDASTTPGWRGIASTVEPIQWMGLESSKRESAEVLVTVHGAPDWSVDAYTGTDPEITAALLLESARIGGEFLRQPLWTQLKRWRYARPMRLADGPTLLSETAGPPLSCCGDWCVAPRVEGAFLSGIATAERLIQGGMRGA